MKMYEFQLKCNWSLLGTQLALVHIMAWRRSGNKPLSEPMMVSLLTHICIAQPQRVNKQFQIYLLHLNVKILWQKIHAKIILCKLSMTGVKFYFLIGVPLPLPFLLSAWIPVKMTGDVQKEFTFKFGDNGHKSTLRVPVPIPLPQSVEDLAGRLINAHKLPCYVEQGKPDENHYPHALTCWALGDQCGSNF